MKEWNNPYNPFNSMKVLLYSQQLQAIADQKFMPPVVADTDPTNKCNYNCIWCNAKDIMQGEKHMLSEEHLLKLADFYKEWGIKSTCVAGGGEPLMNPAFNVFLERLHENGIEIGIITNGSLMTDEHIDVIARTARWCGFSIDAGTPKTYCKVKGIKDGQMFFKVLNNMEKLAYYKSKCNIGFKFLLHPYNYHEITTAANLAFKHGANDFHLRPVGFDNVTGTDKLEYTDEMITEIDKQIEEAMKLETEDFHVYGIRHKFQPNFKRKVNFKRCWTPPLLATFGADGNCHLCFDMRGNKDLIMCRHQDIKEFWGSQKHIDMIANIDVNKCPRCTFGTYNEIIENVFIEDKMCRCHI